MRKRSELTSMEVATGFSVYVVKSLTDEATHDIVYLDIVGSRGACRATMAVFKSRQINNWQLCDHPVRLQKIPGHHQMIKELPNGLVEYLWVSYQSIPQRLQPDMPTFVWLTDEDEQNGKPPKHFYDVFQATMSFPSRPEWANLLWNKGLDKNLIRSMSTRNSNNMTGYGIFPNDGAWEHIIKESFLMGEMSLVDGHKVIRTVPTGEQILDTIKYRRFELGDITISPGVTEMIIEKNIDIIPYFARHAAGDWGEVEWREKNDNNRAVTFDRKITSLYHMYTEGTGLRRNMNILTDAERTTTSARLPKEAEDGTTR